VTGQKGITPINPVKTELQNDPGEQIQLRVGCGCGEGIRGAKEEEKTIKIRRVMTTNMTLFPRPKSSPGSQDFLSILTE